MVRAGPRDVMRKVSKAVVPRRSTLPLGSVPVPLHVSDPAQLGAEGQQSGSQLLQLPLDLFMLLEILGRRTFSSVMGSLALLQVTHPGSGRRAGGKRPAWALACHRGSIVTAAPLRGHLSCFPVCSN